MLSSEAIEVVILEHIRYIQGMVLLTALLWLKGRLILITMSNLDRI